MEYDHILKFIIVGDAYVGKSNLTMRFTRNVFETAQEATIVVEFASKTVYHDNKKYRLQIWDTAGQDAFKVITRNYYRKSIGCIIVFDVTNRKSFDNVRLWFSELKDMSEPYRDNQCIALVGNKIDKNQKERAVSYLEAKETADDLNIMYFEASAKTGENVNDIFDQMVHDISAKIKDGTLVIENYNDILSIKTIDNEYSSYCSC